MTQKGMRSFLAAFGAPHGDGKWSRRCPSCLSWMRTDRENDLALAIRDGPKFMARLQQLADATTGSLLQAPLCSGAAADSSRLWAPANREF
jgi:hypothetical protein